MLARLGAKIIQLVGVPSEVSWAQVQVSNPADAEELASGGTLLSVLCLPATNQAAEEGNEKLQTLVENFQQNLKTDRLEWLKAILADFEEKNHQNERLLLLVIVPHEEKRILYAGGLGPMKVTLERAGKKREIWEVGRNQGQVISGWLNEDDLVVGGTTEFVDEVWSETDGKLTERAEEAQAAIGGHEQQSLMAGVVVELQQLEKEKRMADLPPPVRLPEVAPENTVTRRHFLFSRPDLSQRLLAGKALSWLSGESSRPSRKASLVVGVVFLLMLVASIAVGSVRKQTLERENEFVAFIEPLEHSLEEAKSLKTVNPIRARSLVSEAQAAAGEAGDKFTNDQFNGRWQEFLSKLSQVWTEVSGENQASGKLWLDLTVIRDYLRGAELVWLDDDTLGVIDRTNGAAVAIDLADKASHVLGAGEQIKQMRHAGTWEDEIVVLTSEGVIRYADGKEMVLLEKDGEIWDSLSHIAGFAGNLYLAGGRDIWRYPKLDDGLANRGRWLKPNVEPEISQMADWAIDGEVWVLMNSGKILRFNRGEPVEFELKGLPASSNLVKLAVNTKTKELIVLDKDNQRLNIISQETGEYRRSLVWEKLKDAVGVAVDSEGQRVFVLVDHELYELGL